MKTVYRIIELVLVLLVIVTGTVVGIVCGVIDVVRVRGGLQPWFGRFSD